MRAYVGEVDHGGLRRLVPEDTVPGDEAGRHAPVRSVRSTTVVWTLLNDRDADVIRAEVFAGRNHDACGLLLNRAVELLSVGAVAHGATPRAR